MNKIRYQKEVTGGRWPVGRRNVSAFQHFIIHRSSNPTAFTLVELLVVIAIIGILIALLLPAVQAAREAARRMQCTNNVKQLGLAVHMYHDNFGQFPPGYGYLVGQKGTGAAHGPEWSWQCRLLPFIEQASVNDAFGDWSDYWYNYAINAELFADHYPFFECPSDTTVKTNFMYETGGWTNGLSRSSYAGNFGYGDPTVSNSAGLERTGHIDGVFSRNTGVSLDHIRDGSSNTLMISELIPGSKVSLRGAWWYAEGPVFMEEYTPNDSTPDLVRAGRCGEEDQVTGAVAPCIGSLSEYYMIVQTSRSMHPGGVVSAMCDGSVGFTTDDISLEIWRALGTPEGGETISANER